ncbi:MAG: response regulator [Flavitalea sp.]
MKSYRKSMPQETIYKGLEKRMILVVEDVEMNQYLARHILESWGCIVDIAENGKIAVEKVEQNNFDLVLMDIQMPVMDGMEATKLIRGLTDQLKAHMPIVALTANALRGDSDIYIKAGMNDCLPKPFQEQALFNTVLKNIKKANASIPSDTPKTEIQLPVMETKKMRYDLSMVESISGGDKSFIEKMLNLFLDTVPASLVEIKSASDKKQWPELSKLAHKLKSTVDSMGIAELKQDIRIIESVGKSGGNADELPTLVDKVILAMKEIMTDIKKDYTL